MTLRTIGNTPRLGKYRSTFNSDVEGVEQEVVSGVYEYGAVDD